MAEAVPAGSPAATADEPRLSALVAAFREFGLRWRWDLAAWRQRAPHANDRECIRLYLESEEPGLIAALDADFLVDALHAAATRCHDAIVAGRTALPGQSAPRAPGWGEDRRIEAGA